MQPKISKLHIQQSYLSLIGNRYPLPIDKDTTPSEWKVRFQYIGCQHYCPVCKKWDRDAEYDYCQECSMDYYSHVDVKNGQIAPIRRGWCTRCRINLSLNEQLNCEACYYEMIGQKNRADQINSKRKKIKQEVDSSDIYKQIQRIKKTYGELLMINLCIKGICHTTESKDQLFNKITPEMLGWARDKETRIALTERLWQQYIQKAKQLYKANGICW